MHYTGKRTCQRTSSHSLFMRLVLSHKLYGCHANVKLECFFFTYHVHTLFRFKDLEPGRLPDNIHADELNLGDVFLGVEYIKNQCQEESQDFHSALVVVAAHGICHLLGYRHESEEEWREMFQRENYILNEFNRLTGSQLQPLTKSWLKT
ncbi:hypothetical protein JZ751_029474 [Albula glossodonta]|uniref:Uncharacterized protein n=1 Tax=Albula glossodonta TaxID=121402 RepID=A0A8T2PD93_9TELE|nr:hypothetical protein JZ751_029474 [Albula glossodonta]